MREILNERLANSFDAPTIKLKVSYAELDQKVPGIKERIRK